MIAFSESVDDWKTDRWSFTVWSEDAEIKVCKKILGASHAFHFLKWRSEMVLDLNLL